MNIKMLNPAVGNLSCNRGLIAAAERVIWSGNYILGEEITSFENKVAEYLGVKHAIGVSSGTDALIASLIALEVGPGDEVICPSFTFFATAGAISRVGAIPVFADILPDCFTLDPTDVEKRITSKTKAIIPVHLFGQSCSEELDLLARRENLFIIHDAAQAIGCITSSCKTIGSTGDVTCFSFFPSKNLGGLGDAGLVTTNDSTLAEKLRQTRNHGMVQPYKHQFIGGNFRIDALQAAFLNVKLDYLNKDVIRRVENADTYKSSLAGVKDVILPIEVRGTHTYNQFTIRVLNSRRDELKAYLNRHNIGNAVYYPIPLHKQECFNHLNSYTDTLPETEKTCLEVLSLPVAPELSTNTIEEVSDVIKSF